MKKKVLINDPKDHWKEMPEFIQEKLEPYKKLTIRFDTEKDFEDFSKLIGQKLTNKTKSIWFPFKSHWGDTVDEWVDVNDSTKS